MPGAYCNLLYHFVFSTKERRPLIAAAMKPRLREYIRGILKVDEGELLELDGVADHVHLLVRLHPGCAVADVLRMIKANSSKWMNETARRGPRFAWQEGYAAFTVSPITGAATADLPPRPREAPSPCRLPQRACCTVASQPNCIRRTLLVVSVAR